MTQQSSTTTEVTVSRLLDAPRKLVFEAWTDAKRLARWWGPEVFTNPVCEVDARPGGTMRIVMRGPDGTNYPMTATFHEVVTPERLVFLTVAEDDRGNALLEALTTVTFEDVDGKTRVTVTGSGRPLGPIGIEALKGAEQGWRQSLESLAREVETGNAKDATMTNPTDINTDLDQQTLSMERVFAAPRDLVFKAWTEAEHLTQWWGPTGWTVPFCQVDFRPGGVWHYCMQGPGGEQSWGKAVYGEIVPGSRIVYTDAFSDEAGNITPGMPVMTIAVDFLAEGERTRVVSNTKFASKEELESLLQMGMLEGASQTWDRLDEYLARIQK